MFELAILLTGLLLPAAAWYAYRRTRDPLHPLIVFLPLLFYTYVYRPAVLIENGGLERLFRDRSALDVVGLLNLAGVGAFCLGAAWQTAYGGGAIGVSVKTSPGQRRMLYRHAVALGAIAVSAFVFMIVYSGGFERVFLRGYKPFLNTPSGYIGELPMLSFPALLLLAFAVRGRPLRLGDMVLALTIISPHLIMASLGGRRGPAFLATCALGGFWCLATGRRPKLATVIVGLVGVGLLLLFLASNRRNFYLGSRGSVDLQLFVETVIGDDISTGDEFVVGSAYVLGVQHYRHYTWGLRVFTTVFVRPIPRQIWPTKYEDLGLGWMVSAPGSGGLTEWQWFELLGFIPDAGVAGGFVADTFLEFSWACLLVCFAVGWIYNRMWLGAQRNGGLWSIVYLELLILSVHLPAQSLGAWLYRALLLVIPTWVVWRVLLRLPISSPGRRSALSSPTRRVPPRRPREPGADRLRRSFPE
jgi:hypothetical protein